MLSCGVRAFLSGYNHLFQSLFLPVTLSLLANIGSLVGLAATLWTAWSAYRSKRYYLLVGRVPEQIDDLQDSTSELIDANNSPEADRRDQLRALKNVRIALESIADNIGWKHSSQSLDLLARNTGWVRRSEFLDLKSKIEKAERKESLDSNTLDNIWAEAEALARKAREIVRNSKFTRGS